MEGDTKINFRKIANGDKGVIETLKGMRERILRDAKNKRIVNLARSLRRKKEIDTAKNCFDYVLNNTVYMKDEDQAKILKNFGAKEIRKPSETELLNSPKNLLFSELSVNGLNLNWPYGDCDCMSMSLNSLLVANGMKTFLKIIAVETEDFEHVYSMVLLSDYNKIMPMDVVLEEIGFGYEYPFFKRRAVFSVN